MERVIFGFDLRRLYTTAILDEGPAGLSVTVGLLSRDQGSPLPDLDPVTAPGEDWLWVGLIPLEVRLSSRRHPDQYEAHFSSPPAQFETSSRRRIQPATGDFLCLVSSSLLFTGGAASLWSGQSYISALYSTAA